MESREPALFHELSSLVTEGFLPESADVDSADTPDILRIIHEQDRRVPDAVGACLPEIARVVDAVTASFRAGARLLYVGAGASAAASEMQPSAAASWVFSNPETSLACLVRKAHSAVNTG